MLTSLVFLAALAAPSPDIKVDQAGYLTDGPKIAFVASKALVASLRDDRLGLWQSMDQENRAQAALCDTDDYREGFAAFQQKRRPEFTGRG